MSQIHSIQAKEQKRPNEVQTKLQKNTVNAFRPALNPACRHTRQAATAIMMYKEVQTGAKSQSGGLKDGFWSVWYQLSTRVLLQDDIAVFRANQINQDAQMEVPLGGKAQPADNGKA